MEHSARSPDVATAATATADHIAAVAWRPPPGWTAPPWLDAEPEPASLPMGKERMRWCLHVIGWPQEELSRRLNTNESTVRQMARGRRDIPDELAIWLEMLAARTLHGPLLPSGWRSGRRPESDEY